MSATQLFALILAVFGSGGIGTALVLSSTTRKVERAKNDLDTLRTIVDVLQKENDRKDRRIEQLEAAAARRRKGANE